MGETEFGKWQPIETAPKDGTHILIFCPETDEQFVAYEQQGYWQYACYRPAKINIVCSVASHWMPLPPAP